MIYLFFQIFLWIVAAFCLGLLIGWWLRGKGTQEKIVYRDRVIRDNGPSAISTTETKQRSSSLAKAALLSNSDSLAEFNSVSYGNSGKRIPDAWAPTGLYSYPTTDADDLKKISGIGNKLEIVLNELGIYKFQQIATLSDQNIAWVGEKVNFPGRIEREKWVSQARILASGATTNFSKKVESGEMNYQ